MGRSAKDTLKLIDYMRPKKVKEELSKMQALINTLSKQKEELVLALEIACESVPMSTEYCQSPPIYHDLQKEYGLDEPYIDIEDQCIDTNNCVECVKNHFLTKARERLGREQWEE